MDQLVGSALSSVSNWAKAWLRRWVISPREEQLIAHGAVVEQREQVRATRCRIAASSYLARRAGRRVS